MQADEEEGSGAPIGMTDEVLTTFDTNKNPDSDPINGSSVSELFLDSEKSKNDSSCDVRGELTELCYVLDKKNTSTDDPVEVSKLGVCKNNANDSLNTTDACVDLSEKVCVVQETDSNFNQIKTPEDTKKSETSFESITALKDLKAVSSGNCCTMFVGDETTDVESPSISSNLQLVSSPSSVLGSSALSVSSAGSLTPNSLGSSTPGSSDLQTLNSVGSSTPSSIGSLTPPSNSSASTLISAGSVVGGNTCDDFNIATTATASKCLTHPHSPIQPTVKICVENEIDSSLAVYPSGSSNEIPVTIANNGNSNDKPEMGDFRQDDLETISCSTQDRLLSEKVASDDSISVESDALVNSKSCLGGVDNNKENLICELDRSQMDCKSSNVNFSESSACLSNVNQKDGNCDKASVPFSGSQDSVSSNSLSGFCNKNPALDYEADNNSTVTLRSKAAGLSQLGEDVHNHESILNEGSEPSTDGISSCVGKKADYVERTAANIRSNLLSEQSEKEENDACADQFVSTPEALPSTNSGTITITGDSLLSPNSAGQSPTKEVYSTAVGSVNSCSSLSPSGSSIIHCQNDVAGGFSAGPPGSFVGSSGAPCLTNPYPTPPYPTPPYGSSGSSGYPSNSTYSTSFNSYSGIASYPTPSTPSSGYTNPNTPSSSYPNPNTPGSCYQNPNTPNSSYNNPTTPGNNNYGNPGTPSSVQPASSSHSANYANPSTPSVQYSNPLTPSSFQNPGSPGSACPNSTTPGLAFPNPSTPGTGYPNPTTPGTTYPNPSTPGSTYPNPSTPGSAYPNPSTPGSAYPNPSTPGSAFQNPAASGSIYHNSVNGSSYPHTSTPGSVYPHSTTPASNFRQSPAVGCVPVSSSKSLNIENSGCSSGTSNSLMYGNNSSTGTMITSSVFQSPVYSPQAATYLAASSTFRNTSSTNAVSYRGNSSTEGSSKFNENDAVSSVHFSATRSNSVSSLHAHDQPVSSVASYGPSNSNNNFSSNRNYEQFNANGQPTISTDFLSTDNVDSRFMSSSNNIIPYSSMKHSELLVDNSVNNIENTGSTLTESSMNDVIGNTMYSACNSRTTDNSSFTFDNREFTNSSNQNTFSGSVLENNRNKMFSNFLENNSSRERSRNCKYQSMLVDEKRQFNSQGFQGELTHFIEDNSVMFQSSLKSMIEKKMKFWNDGEEGALEALTSLTNSQRSSQDHLLSYPAQIRASMGNPRSNVLLSSPDGYRREQFMASSDSMDPEFPRNGQYLQPGTGFRGSQTSHPYTSVNSDRSEYLAIKTAYENFPPHMGGPGAPDTVLQGMSDSLKSGNCHSNKFSHCQADVPSYNSVPGDNSNAPFVSTPTNRCSDWNRSSGYREDNHPSTSVFQKQYFSSESGAVSKDSSNEKDAVKYNKTAHVIDEENSTKGSGRSNYSRLQLISETSLINKNDCGSSYRQDSFSSSSNTQCSYTDQRDLKPFCKSNYGSHPSTSNCSLQQERLDVELYRASNRQKFNRVCDIETGSNRNCQIEQLNNFSYNDQQNYFYSYKDGSRTPQYYRGMPNSSSSRSMSSEFLERQSYYGNLQLPQSHIPSGPESVYYYLTPDTIYNEPVEFLPEGTSINVPLRRIECPCILCINHRLNINKFGAQNIRSHTSTSGRGRGSWFAKASAKHRLSMKLSMSRFGNNDLSCPYSKAIVTPASIAESVKNTISSVIAKTNLMSSSKSSESNISDSNNRTIYDRVNGALDNKSSPNIYPGYDSCQRTSEGENNECLNRSFPVEATQLSSLPGNNCNYIGMKDTVCRRNSSGWQQSSAVNKSGQAELSCIERKSGRLSTDFNVAEEKLLHEEKDKKNRCTDGSSCRETRPADTPSGNDSSDTQLFNSSVSASTISAPSSNQTSVSNQIAADTIKKEGDVNECVSGLSEIKAEKALVADKLYSFCESTNDSPVNIRHHHKAKKRKMRDNVLHYQSELSSDPQSSGIKLKIKLSHPKPLSLHDISISKSDNEISSSALSYQNQIASPIDNSLLVITPAAHNQATTSTFDFSFYDDVPSTPRSTKKRKHIDSAYVKRRRKVNSWSGSNLARKYLLDISGSGCINPKVVLNPIKSAQRKRKRPRQRARSPSSDLDDLIDKTPEIAAVEEDKDRPQSLWATSISHEILLRIFQYVMVDENSVPTLLRLGRVCKLWNEVSQDYSLWHTADLSVPRIRERYRNELQILYLLQTKFRAVKHLNLSGWSDAVTSLVLERIALQCSSTLESLNLSYCNKLHADNISAVLANCSRLHSVDLTNIMGCHKPTPRGAVGQQTLVELFEMHGSRLVSLVLADNTISGLPCVISSLASLCHNLQILDLSRVETVGRDCLVVNLESLQVGCPKLRVLRLSLTKAKFTQATMAEQAASPGFPELEHLYLANDDRQHIGVNDHELERVLKNSTRLTLLDVKGCLNVSDSSLVRIPPWHIENLYLAGGSSVKKYSDRLELVIKKWAASLQELDLAWTGDGEVVDAALCAVAEDAANLRVLNLCGSSCTLAAVQRVLARCPLLCEINLSSCRALPRGIKRLYQNQDMLTLRTQLEEMKDHL